MMHAHNQIVPGKTIEELKKLRTDFPGRGPHTLTGPIYIQGAEPGDVLKVKINRIEPRAYGVNFNLPGLFGQFPDDFPDGQVKYLYLDLGAPCHRVSARHRSAARAIRNAGAWRAPNPAATAVCRPARTEATWTSAI